MKSKSFVFALTGLMLVTFSKIIFAQPTEKRIKPKFKLGAVIQSDDVLLTGSVSFKLPLNFPLWINTELISRPWGKSVLVQDGYLSYYQFKEEIYGFAVGPELKVPLVSQFLSGYLDTQIGFFYFNRRGTDKFDKSGLLSPKISVGVIVGPFDKFGFVIGWDYLKVDSWTRNTIGIGVQIGD